MAGKRQAAVASIPQPKTFNKQTRKPEIIPAAARPHQRCPPTEARGAAPGTPHTNS